MTRLELLTFMRGYPMVIQASVSEAGVPQAAVVGAVVTDTFEVFFDTIDSTRKARNLRNNSRIALVIGGAAPGDVRTVQYEGVADEPGGTELDALRNLYLARFPDGRERLAWPGLIYLRARPTWLRYSDFSRQPPLIVELTAENLDQLA